MEHETDSSGATIFNAGVTDWAFGPKHDDPDVVRITRNVLDRLSEPSRSSSQPETQNVS